MLSDAQHRSGTFWAGIVSAVAGVVAVIIAWPQLGSVADHDGMPSDSSRSIVQSPGAGPKDPVFTAEMFDDRDPGDVEEMVIHQEDGDMTGRLVFETARDHRGCSYTVSRFYPDQYLDIKGCLFALEAVYSGEGVDGDVVFWIFEFDTEEQSIDTYSEVSRDMIDSTDTAWHFVTNSDDDFSGDAYVNDLKVYRNFVIAMSGTIRSPQEGVELTEFVNGANMKLADLAAAVNIGSMPSAGETTE